MIRRLVWLGVISVGGGGIFYAVHPHAKECEAIVKTANVAVDAGNGYREGDPIEPVLATMNTTANKLTELSAKFHHPFDTDAQNAATSLRSMVTDFQARDAAGYQRDMAAFNEQVDTTNSDCRQASGNVVG